jgi:hypothetical protein
MGAVSLLTALCVPRWSALAPDGDMVRNAFAFFLDVGSATPYC